MAKLVFADWLLFVSIAMQIVIALSYGYAGHWGKCWYWLSVTSINSSLAYLTVGRAL